MSLYYHPAANMILATGRENFDLRKCKNFALKLTANFFIIGFIYTGKSFIIGFIIMQRSLSQIAYIPYWTDATGSLLKS